MRRPYQRPRRRSEAADFSWLLRDLREKLEWTQFQLATRLGVSSRTLSSWELAHWLPSYKERVHVVLALSRHAPPEYVLAAADALGVSVDPAVAKFLEPFKEAAGEADPKEASAVVAQEPPPPEPPPPQPRATEAELRALVDPIILDAANALDARPNDVRAIVARVVAACAGVGGTLEDAAKAVTATAPKASGAIDRVSKHDRAT